MNLHEYQGKEILNSYGVGIQRGIVASTPEAAVDAAKKLTEETTELLLAVNSRQTSEMVHEAADLLFHYLVLLEKVNISLEEVVDELLSREGVSGFQEKRERKEKSS